MEGLGFTWSYQEQVDDLKEKMLCTEIDLEEFKLEVREVMRKHEEDMKQLIQIVTQGSSDQQNLSLNIPPSSTYFPNTILNYDPQISYDPFFNSVTPPKFTNMDINDLSSNIGFVNTPMYDKDQDKDKKYGPSNLKEFSLIDLLIQGRPLPQRGQLLKAVTDAGPLLQDLVLAGQLPNWRNPPQMDTILAVPPPFQINNAINLDTIASRLKKSRPVDLWKWSTSQSQSQSSASASASASSYYTVLGKKQRLQ